MRPVPRDQVLALVLVAPAFLYLGGLLISGYQGWDATSAFGFLLVPLLLLIGLYPIWGALVEFLGFVLLGLVASVATLTGSLGTTGYDLAAGLLLSTPFLLALWSWGPQRTAASRLLGLGLSLLEGIILLATIASIHANPSYQENAQGLFSWYTQVNIEQLCGLANLFAAAPSTCAITNQFPLRDIVDPVFVFLAGLAFLGALLPVLVPRTARGDAGDAESWEEFDASSRVPPDVLLTDEMLFGLRMRSPPRSSPELLPPGASALLGATLLTLVFVLFAVEDAPAALLPMMGCVIAALGAILALDRPVSAHRRRLPDLTAAVGAPPVPATGAGRAAPLAPPPGPMPAPPSPAFVLP